MSLTRGHAFSDPVERGHPVVGSVLSKGAATISVAVGATVLKNVVVATPLTVADIAVGDTVALIWHGEKAYAISILE